MISIIIPVYRSEKTLQRCIESLINQTCRDIEIIMIVDGPPDASGILADKLAAQDNRIRVIHQKNQGVSAARNAGIEAAEGEYIQFVDSDDYLESTACEELLMLMQKEKADMVICGFHHLYYGRDVIKIPEKTESFLLIEDKKEFLYLYQAQFLNMPWNKLYKRELIVDGFAQGLDLGEDLLFNLQYMKRVGRVSVLAKPLCYYIQDDRGTTLSTKRRENRMENAWLLYSKMQEFCQVIYGNTGSGGILESKLLTEFMDEIEGLAFDKELKYKEKIQIILKYYSGYDKVENKNVIRLGLLDYRILYFFFRRKLLSCTYLLAVVRAWVVKLSGRRK